MTYDEEDDVDSNTKDPVEDGDEQTEDGSEQEESHGVSVLLSWVVKGVLSTVSVNLLRDETEQGDRDTECQSSDDELLISLCCITWGNGTHVSKVSALE